MPRICAARFELLRAACAALSLASATALAAPGDTLFYDNLNGNLNAWNVSGAGDVAITNETAQAGRSMRLGEGAVSAHSDPFDATVPAAELTVWIRRGADSFSEDPDNNEDLVVEYRTAANAWVALETFPGAGAAGEILQRTYPLPAAALHGNASIRFRHTGADGEDYWHVDDPRVREVAPLSTEPPFGVGTCETFESGLLNWTIVSAGGDADTSTQTASSPTSSMYTRGGVVTVTGNAIDLAGATFLSLNVWVREGGNFSNAPENDEDLLVQYLDSSATWVDLETFQAGAPSGDIFARSYPLPAAAMHSGFRVRFRQLGGNGNGDYWHVDDVCLTTTTPIILSFEEDAWTGAAGEVLDGGANGLTGIAAGGAQNDDLDSAIAGDPGTCRYGDFDGVDDFIEVADHPALDIGTELTVAAWIRMRSTPSELHTIVSKDTNYEFHIDSSRRVYWWWNDASGNVRSITTTTQIQLDQWYHVAVTYQSGAQRVYINGVVQGTTGNYTGALAQNGLPFYVGTDWNFISRAFHGLIDEVRVIPRALTAAEIQALSTETHECPSAAAQFTINHDTFGIHCVAETVTVDVVDAIAGTPLVNYNAQVQLDTQSGFGTWALVTGTGAFDDGAADDGAATYAWPLGESQAVFALSYPQGPPSLDVDVYQISDNGIRDTDAEGNLVFSPNGFTVTAGALGNPPLPPIVSFGAAQTAGAAFPLHIAAYGQTPDDPVCGVIEAYTGNKNLKLWSSYGNPGTGTRNVTIDGSSVAIAEGAAAAQLVAFANGQAVVTAKYKDVGEIRISMKDDTTADATQLPSGIRGATASFVVRPHEFVLSNIRNAAGTIVNPQANDANGGVFVAAGSPFRATVTALDAEGSATPNYGRENVPESVRLEAELHAPAGGANPPVGAAVGFAAFANGTATGTDFTWHEVGIVRVRPGVADADYLGAGDVTGAVSERIGRFVPDHFTVTLNAPLFATACVAGGFTYHGQPFDYLTAPMITASARSASGAITQNYAGAFFKLAESTLQNRTYTSSTGSLDVAGVPAPAVDPAVAATGPGTATLTFSGGSGFLFTKGAPEAPFTADIRLSIDVLDADGVAAIGAGPLGNPVTFGAAGGMPWSGGGQIRYGRVRIGTATGSELVDLAVPMIAEHFQSPAAGFVVNGNDTCSGGVTLALAGFTENLAAGETCVRDVGTPGASGVGCAAAAPPGMRYAEPPFAGDFGLRLAAPGAGNNGSALINATVPAWLRYDWNASTAGDEEPTGQATFGIFGGESKQIYIREIY